MQSATPAGAVTVAKVHPARPGTRQLTAEAMWRIPRVGTPVPSPDGSQAAVPVATCDLATNQLRTRIWLVAAAGGAAVPVTAAELDSREPAWSPDGKRLAFVRKGPEKDAKPQLCVMSLADLVPERVTDLPLGVFDPTWIDGGRAIVFGAKLLRGHLTVEATAAEAERRAKEPQRPFVTEDRVFRFWDTWLTDGEIPHLFRLDLATPHDPHSSDLREARRSGSAAGAAPAGSLRDLMPWSTSWFNWMDPSGQYDVSPDGSEIAYAGAFFDERRGLLRGGVFVVPTAAGPAAPRCLTLDHPHDDGRPRWTPDGKSIVWESHEDPFFYADRIRLRRWDRATGKDAVVLGDWHRSPAGIEIARDGSVWFHAEDDARTSLYRWDGHGAPVRAAAGGTVGAVAPAADGAVWFASGTMSEPSEVWRLAPGAKAPVRVTHFTDAALDGVAQGEVREVRFAGAAGEQVQMFVIHPPGHDPDAPGAKPLPMVHVIHGGPHGISGDQFHPRWNAQIFASWGYVVAMVNFQGSTSWGQDFAQRIQGTWGDRPYEDVMRATDALVALGWADPARMAATGASYGGYLVSWIAGHTDRFRCIVNHAGVFDSWVQYASDVTQGRARAFGGEPWDRVEGLDRWSPARHAAGFVTPMLVTHGAKDYRVPSDQGLQCYAILKAKGVPARLVYFPDENHWVLKPRNSLLWYAEVETWLARWLGAGTSA